MTIIENDIAQFNKLYGGSITSLGTERVAYIDSPEINGTVIQSKLSSGMQCTMYAFEMTESLVMTYPIKDEFGIFFVYCMDGDIAYRSLSEEGDYTNIDEYCTAIFAGRRSAAGISIKINKDQKVRYCVISVSGTVPKNGSSLASNETFAESLYRRFLEDRKNSSYEYVGSHNLKIKEQFEEIYNIKNKGTIRRLLLEGVIHFVLAMEIKQYEKDISTKDTLDTSLSKTEMIRIQELIQRIKNKPGEAYTVDGLCMEIGMGANKVQEGFKKLTGYTINNFIRVQRLETSLEMIHNGDYNISEVVYTVGFSSRSYFSKIFKQHYGCSPKEYMSNTRMSATSA